MGVRLGFSPGDFLQMVAGVVLPVLRLLLGFVGLRTVPGWLIPKRVKILP
jgi:uncharacterized membrane protein